MLRLATKLKYLLLLVSLSTLVNADYLLYLEKNKDDSIKTYCIVYYDYSDNGNLYFKESSNPNKWKKVKLKNYKTLTISSGYYFDKDDVETCKRFTSSINDVTLDDTLALNSSNLSYLGLSNKDINLIFAFSGMLISFLFLFGLFRWI
jgi:hypothetical protein